MKHVYRPVPIFGVFVVSVIPIPAQQESKREQRVAGKLV